MPVVHIRTENPSASDDVHDQPDRFSDCPAGSDDDERGGEGFTGLRSIELRNVESRYLSPREDIARTIEATRRPIRQSRNIAAAPDCPASLAGRCRNQLQTVTERQHTKVVHPERGVGNGVLPHRVRHLLRT